MMMMMMMRGQTHRAWWFRTSKESLDWKRMHDTRTWASNAIVHFDTPSVQSLTFRPAGTPPPNAAASWPSVCLGPSCPRRSRPPPGPWAGGLAASAAACQSCAPPRCCRSYQSGRCRFHPSPPCLWMPPFHSRRSYLRRGARVRFTFYLVKVNSPNWLDFYLLHLTKQVRCV